MPACSFGAELVEGFEVVGYVVGDGSLSLVEDEHICAGAGGKGEGADASASGGRSTRTMAGGTATQEVGCLPLRLAVRCAA
jgi:hypothetical protein